MKWNAQRETESALDSYTVKGTGYMGSLDSVNQDVFAGTYS